MLTERKIPRKLYWILCGLVTFTGFLNLAAGVRSLLEPYVYRKDFMQEYLLARAVLAGVNPYLPLPELASRLIGELPVRILPHPTPHPPTVAVFTLPLGFLEYQLAATIWLCIEVACLIGSAYILTCELSVERRLPITLLLSVILVSTRPFWAELTWGQLGTILLLLLILAWKSLRCGQDQRGGIFLGIVFALKLMGWPILLFLVIRRRFRAALSAGVAILLFNLLSMALMGPERVSAYYLYIGRTIFAAYRAHAANYSLWSVGWRWFDGTGSPVLAGWLAPPLMHIPLLASSLSFILPVTVAAVALAALKSHEFDTAFSALVALSVVANPVSWEHYIVLMVLPVVIAGQHIINRRLRNRFTILVLVLILLLVFPQYWWGVVAETLSSYTGRTTAGEATFWAGQITLVPLIVNLGWVWLLWRLPQIRMASVE